MKRNSFIKLTTRLMSLLLVISILLPTAGLGIVAEDNKGDEIVLDNVQNNSGVSENENSKSKYAEDEVLIMLADTQQTRSMQFCSLYSDDIADNSEVLSLRSYDSKTIADTNIIESELSLGINVKEMRLLNPSESKARNGLYSVESDHNNIFLLKLDGTSVEDALEILNDNPAIDIAEPNYYYEFDARPNDPGYNLQYALKNIKAESAWNYTKGNSNVVVGIIDTGIDGTHPDLVDNLWNNPYYTQGVGCSRCSRSDDIHGYNFTGEGNNNEPCGGIPTDINGHGTHVAGIIGAKGNNSKGICGVNWNVSLAWLGVCNGREISTSSAIEAINYANNHNILIINASYGGYAYSIIEERAISNYRGLFVAAAGNDGVNNDTVPHYPASYNCPNIISVASADRNNNLSVFTSGGSNYGSKSVHVAAPGSDIYSTFLNNTYENKSGTSMSTPCVTGIAALIKAKNPSFNPQQIKAAICGTVQQSGKKYNIIYDGGIVDANAALAVTSSSLKSITFNYNYSGAPSSSVEYVVSGKKVVEPRFYPERSGYIFKGWYTTSSGNTLFDFNKTITSNTIIYARWTPVAPNTYGEKFPDYKFRNEILRLMNWETNGSRTVDSIVTQNDIWRMETFRNLDVSSMNIHDLKGIEYFTGLTELNCSCNGLSYLNLDTLTELERLNCSYNQLTSLSVGSSLIYLYCHHNQLTKLNIMNAKNIAAVDCSYNKLYVLNTIGLSKLIDLDVSYNEMSEKSDVIGYHYWDFEMSFKGFSPQNKWYDIPFDDVPADEYYYKAVQYVYNKGVMQGTSSSLFKPKNTLSRASLATILYRMAGSPDVFGLLNPFTDVSENASYLNAVKWVYNNGNNAIMNGTSGTTFNPDGMVTREMMAVVMDRYAIRRNITLNKLYNYTAFSDDSNISSWAKNSVIKLYESGIINGINNYFNPLDNIDRSSVAVIIRRFEVIRLYL